jgi:hypothetical protein
LRISHWQTLQPAVRWDLQQVRGRIAARRQIQCAPRRDNTATGVRNRMVKSAIMDGRDT